LSPSSIGEVSIITLVALTLGALNPLAFFVILVAVVFTTLAIAFCRCLLSAANAHPLAAPLSSADAGATAASRPPAEPLLPFMALYFIMADCYIVASAPALSSHCCSRHHCCHHFMIVTYRPSTLTEESVQKKKKAEKVYFYLRHNKLVFSESKYITIAHKNQKRITAVTQYKLLNIVFFSNRIQKLFMTVHFFKYK
jgi:hypothetical protein